MAYFKSTDEVHQFIGRIFEEAVKDQSIGPKMAASGVVLKLDYSDPSAIIIVDMPNRQVHLGQPEGISPNVVMMMKADVGHRFWLGKVSIPLALAKGDIRAKGPMPKILKLVPLANELFPRYRGMVEEAGRSDLLAV